MASFGENLRREREMRSVSLEEISAATKISVRFLSAIEKEQFDKLPGGIFNRGFVRAYAGYLGLDEEKIAAEFALAAGEPEAPLPRSVARAEVGPSYARPVFFVLVILGVATGLVYGWYGRHVARPNAAPAVTSSPAPAPVSGAPAPSPSTVSSETSPTSQPTATEATGSVSEAGKVRATADTATGVTPAPSSPATTEGTPRLRLQIDVMEPAWVNVTADGRRLITRTLQSRETLSVSADRVIRLTTGNASAVVLTLNGETLAPLGKPGEVKTVTLTEKELKTPAP